MRDEKTTSEREKREREREKRERVYVRSGWDYYDKGTLYVVGWMVEEVRVVLYIIYPGIQN